MAQQQIYLKFHWSLAGGLIVFSLSFCQQAFAIPPSVLQLRPQASVIAESTELSSAWDFPGNPRESDTRVTESIISDSSSGSEAGYQVGTAPEPVPLGSNEENPGLAFFPTEECSTDYCSNGCGGNGGIFGNLVKRHRGHWVGRFDSLLLWRNAPSSRPIFVDSAGAEVLNADQLESDVLAAPRLSLFHLNECGYGVEATYIYAGTFYAERGPYTSVSQANIFNNPSVGPLDPEDYDTAQAKVLGRFQSFEVNGRTPMGAGNVQFIAGIRWLQWHEWAEVTGTGSTPSPAEFNDTFETECFNDLYGGQIGFDTLLYQTAGGIRLEGLIKAGAYYNSAVQASQFTLVQNPGTNAFNQSRVAGTPAGGAFMGEVGLTGVVPIGHAWALRAGYTGFWLESIAQPINQFSGQTLTASGASEGSLTTTGRLVLQGLSLGLEGRW